MPESVKLKSWYWNETSLWRNWNTQFFCLTVFTLLVLNNASRTQSTDVTVSYSPTGILGWLQLGSDEQWPVSILFNVGMTRRVTPWKESLWQRWKVAAAVETQTGRLYLTLRRSTWDTETRYTHVVGFALTRSNIQDMVTRDILLFKDDSLKIFKDKLKDWCWIPNNKYESARSQAAFVHGAHCWSVKPRCSVTLSLTALLCKGTF